MSKKNSESLEFTDRSILDLAGHLKDAFLHTDIPDGESTLGAIPSDKTFIQMAQYLTENNALMIFIPNNPNTFKENENAKS